MDKEPSSVKKE